MPIIEKIESVKRNPSKAKLVFEENSYVVDLDTIAYFACYEGKEIDENELEEILKHSLQRDLQERTINYISYSPRTEFQVRQYIKKYLRKIGILDLNIDYEEIINKVIKKLKEYKYLNDEEYAKLFVKSRLENKPKSRYFLLSELMSKGIQKDLANEVLDSLLPDSFEILKKVYEKKFKNEPLTFEDKKKITYLQRKGFLWDDISTLVNSFEKNNNEL